MHAKVTQMSMYSFIQSKCWFLRGQTFTYMYSLRIRLYVHPKLPWWYIQRDKRVTAVRPKSQLGLSPTLVCWPLILPRGTQKARWQKTQRETAVLVKEWQRWLRQHGDLSLTSDRGEDNPLTSSVGKKGQKCFIVTKLTMRCSDETSSIFPWDSKTILDTSSQNNNGFLFLCV